MIKSLGKDVSKIYSLGEEVNRVYSLGEIVYNKTEPKWYDEYGEIADYVISNGTDNYLKLGVNTQNDLIIETKMSYLSLDTQSGFGGIVGSGSTRNVVEGASYTGTSPYWGYTSTGRWVTMESVPVAIGQDLDYRFEYASRNQKVYLNGSLVSTDSQTVNIVNQTEMYLFARNFGNVPNEPTMGKWWGFKLEKPGGAVLADLVPFHVSKKSMTDRAGRVHPVGSFVMIDNVREDVPAIIGQSLAGQTKIPTWVYDLGAPIYGIKTTGLSWITTDFDLGYTGKTVIKTTTDNVASTKGLYGWYSAGGNRVAIGIASGKWFAGKDNTNYNKTAIIGESVTITMDRDNNLFSVNGTNVALTPVSRDISFKAYLGHRSNTEGGAFSSPYIGVIQLWQEYATNGSLIRNSIPLVHKDGAVGLVDLITGKFEVSATDTPFEAVTLESSIMALNEIGITPTVDLETNNNMLNEVGVI